MKKKHKYFVEEDQFVLRELSYFEEPHPPKEIFPDKDPNDFLNYCGKMGFADYRNAYATAKRDFVWYLKGYNCKSMVEAATACQGAYAAVDEPFERGLKDKEFGLPKLNPKWLKKGK